MSSFDMKLYEAGVNAAYAEYLSIKSVMPNGGCGLTDDEDAWLHDYLECNPRFNYRLQESAPELLAALELITKWCEVSGFGNSTRSKQWTMLESARAVIAKARGE